MQASEKDPVGWRNTIKFKVVLQTVGLNTTELNAYCQERGLYPQQVGRWRQASQEPTERQVLTLKEQNELEELGAQVQRGIKGSSEVQVEGVGTGGSGNPSDRLKKDSGLLGRGRGHLRAPDDRRKPYRSLVKELLRRLCP